MKNKIYYFSLLLMASLITLSSCELDKDSNSDDVQGSMQLSVLINNSDLTKSEVVTDSLKPKYIMYSIMDESGNVVDTLQKVALYPFNNTFVTSPISIKTGKYTLTSFFVLNQDEEVIYACPLENSEKALLVQNPLPISFSIQKDIVTTISPEVIPVSNSKAEDFGYATFVLNIYKTFNFDIALFRYNDFQSTGAQIEIIGNNKTYYSKQIENKTTLITLLDSISTYTIKVSKPGYFSIDTTVSSSVLKSHLQDSAKGPFILTLKNKIDGLIAYFPFDGNANNNSSLSIITQTVNATLCTDKNGQLSNAYSFIGYNSGITSNKSIISTPPYSLSFWFYAAENASKNQYLLSNGAQSAASEGFAVMIASETIKNSYSATSAGLLFIVSNKELNFKTASFYPFQLGSWHHVAATWDGIPNNSAIKLYIDGFEVAGQEYTDLEVGFGSSFNFIMGKPSVFNDFYFKGKLDEVQIYNKVLSDTEIANLAK